MTHAPSTCGCSAKQDLAVAREMVGLTREHELDRFVPQLLESTFETLKKTVPGVAKTAPAVSKVATPILKKAVAKALPKIKAAPARRAHGGKTVAPSGFGGGVGTRGARLWGTGFQRTRPREIQIAMSLRFVRAARAAARRAALAVLRQIQGGQPVTEQTLRRTVYRALLGAVRAEAPFLLPTMGTVASSLRRPQGYTGPKLPLPRPGRIEVAPRSLAGAPVPRGYTGRTLPSPKGAVLGAAPRFRRPVRSRPQREQTSADRFW